MEQIDELSRIEDYVLIEMLLIDVQFVLGPRPDNAPRALAIKRSQNRFLTIPLTRCYCAQPVTTWES